MYIRLKKKRQVYPYGKQLDATVVPFFHLIWWHSSYSYGYEFILARYAQT